jgi:hypothetical protein
MLRKKKTNFSFLQKCVIFEICNICFVLHSYEHIIWSCTLAFNCMMNINFSLCRWTINWLSWVNPRNLSDPKPRIPGDRPVMPTEITRSGSLHENLPGNCRGRPLVVSKVPRFRAITWWEIQIPDSDLSHKALKE